MISEKEQEMFPILCPHMQEMEGKLIAYFNPYQEDGVTLVNGTKTSAEKYIPERLSWETNGFLATDGKYYGFPKKLQYNHNRWNSCSNGFRSAPSEG